MITATAAGVQANTNTVTRSNARRDLHVMISRRRLAHTSKGPGRCFIIVLLLLVLDLTWPRALCVESAVSQAFMLSSDIYSSSSGSST
jgi:hypothetical protein